MAYTVTLCSISADQESQLGWAGCSGSGTPSCHTVYVRWKSELQPFHLTGEAPLPRILRVERCVSLGVVGLEGLVSP